MTLRLITPPTQRPIDLDIARQHLRQDSGADDVMIELYLAAAVQSVQDMTGRALLPQTWEYRLDVPAGCVSQPLQIPLAPLLSVESVMLDGVAVAPDAYGAVMPSGPTCGRGFLDLGDASGAAVIRFRAGYEAPQMVPAALQAAVLLALGSLYENREAEAEKSGTTARMLAENPAYMRLLRPYMLIG
ncbi:hypothetical protein [Pseudoroseomonas cervicalis]|uniref:head-tail connector protein n=1 Tax=Teichococcus cervicalis TaxID=204525 RepID=UPI0027820C87|nr:hypothetical protein [Pseudoroseomonas cervicalis]MDQ1078004.1 putative phiE125 gp8 family phage protein [Pseudoroseomonas cervicalis]